MKTRNIKIIGNMSVEITKTNMPPKSNSKTTPKPKNKKNTTTQAANSQEKPSKSHNSTARVHFFGETINNEEQVQEEKISSMSQTENEQKITRQLLRAERRQKRQRNCHHHGDHSLGLVMRLGIVMLILNLFNLVPWNFWNNISKFWPLLLVIWGIEFILGCNSISRVISYIITIIACLFVLLYGLIQVSSPSVNFLPTGFQESIKSINLNING